MTNFWDLPKHVREKIYRIHLVRREKISVRQHEKVVKPGSRVHKDPYCMPLICYVSKRLEKEAAPIYYGENHFEFDGWVGLGSDPGEPNDLRKITYPRHLWLIRKVTFQWQHRSWATQAFMGISRLRGLQELYIGVDEADLIQGLPNATIRGPRARADPTPQQALAMLRHPNIPGLLSISNVRHVEFVKLVDKRGNLVGGPIPGGVLETQIRPKLMASKRSRLDVLPKRAFRFLDLPPELRNRIYTFHLEVAGLIYPSTEPPSSITKAYARKSGAQGPGSVLNILRANRQIHDEAFGIFYNSNTFAFTHQAQLQAFLLCIGPERQKYVRDITLNYRDTRVSGIHLDDLTFPILKQLPRLRRLVILLHGTTGLGRWSLSPVRRIEDPMELPGMQYLFEFRGITELKVRDVYLEEAIARYKYQPPENDLVKMSRMLKLLNAGLAEAQEVRVEKAFLKSKDWYQELVEIE